MQCLLHAQHEDITTLLVPYYVHTTCHNLQRHKEHMIRTYTARWHTYLVQQYRSYRRKSNHDHESNESKKCMPCGAIYTIHAYQCFVYIAYKKKQWVKAGRISFALCTALRSMTCVTPSFCTNLITSYSSPPLSRDHDHRFSSLMRPAVSFSAVSACGYPAACVIRDTASSCFKRDFQHDKIKLNSHGTFFNIP